jgi:hypothetical protein
MENVQKHNICPLFFFIYLLFLRIFIIFLFAINIMSRTYVFPGPKSAKHGAWFCINAENHSHTSAAAAEREFSVGNPIINKQ